MFKDREPLITEICQRLSLGEPLAQICRDLHMPDRTTVFDWAKENESISQRIAHARIEGFDAIADECLEIADKSTDDFKPSAQGPAFNPEHVQRSKLRVETRLKLLAKWDPKRYGDKQQVEHSGSINTANTIIESRRRSGRS
jgi:hypothetical protein